jgi:hypothetical protein
VVLATVVEANRAFRVKDYSTALRLYRQVAERTAAAGGSPEERSARAFARFRIVLIDALVGQEDDARAVLEAMRQQDSSSPFLRLALLFWDTYGMTADPQAACAQVTRQVREAPAPILTPLSGVPNLTPDEVCVVPA